MIEIDRSVQQLAQRNFVDRLTPQQNNRCYACKRLMQSTQFRDRYRCNLLEQPIPSPSASKCFLFEV